MKTIWKGLPVVLFCFVLLVSCSKPFVGTRVSYDCPLAVPIGAGGEFSFKTEHFDFLLTLKFTDKPNSYILDGNAAYIGPPLGTNRGTVTFSLLPVRNGIIVDNISLDPASISSGKTLPIRRTFSCPGGFEALMISYQMFIINGNINWYGYK